MIPDFRPPDAVRLGFAPLYSPLRRCLGRRRPAGAARADRRVPRVARPAPRGSHNALRWRISPFQMAYPAIGLHAPRRYSTHGRHVHRPCPTGAWADGSCWSAVIERLQADGYKVTAPQLPETSLADDVARVRHVLTRQSGPTILAAHSYGGQVITSLGTDAPNVVGLVYIAAFGTDEGESIGALPQEVLRPRRWRISMSTRRASPGSPRTISSVTSPPISTRSRRRSCTPQQPLPMSTYDDVMAPPRGRHCPRGIWSPRTMR